MHGQENIQVMFSVVAANSTSGHEVRCSPRPSVKVRNSLGTSPVQQTSHFAVCLLNFCIVSYALYPIIKKKNCLKIEG